MLVGVIAALMSSNERCPRTSTIGKVGIVDGPISNSLTPLSRLERFFSDEVPPKQGENKKCDDGGYDPYRDVHDA